MSKTFRVVWRQTASDDLYHLYDWIADRADPETAFAYTSAIEAHAAARISRWQRIRAGAGKII
ncbi:MULTISPECIES: hypothetical protein [unclassified Sphingopyxis]|uniref:hypothetical protein n=1 Tax=unclassified Sphingopyxis TaxID=2614943 RepID=UPI0025F2F675|nr:MULTISPECIES: hypothetical protein [unclassified Sphingopyxis]